MIVNRWVMANMGNPHYGLSQGIIGRTGNGLWPQLPYFWDDRRLNKFWHTACSINGDDVDEFPR